MSNNIVSVIIPSFNNSNLLKEMIECILMQTYPNWELLVIDDGSTDDSREVVEEYTKKDNRMKLLIRDRLPKGGQTCRNIGFEHSQGSYVCFFDSDDLVSENCLMQRVKYMEENPDLDFAVFPAHSFKNGTDHRLITKTMVSWGNKNVKDPLDCFLRNDYPYTVWTNIYRRNSIVDIKWDDRVLVRQDLDFNISTLLGGKKAAIAFNAEYDYFYRGAFGENNVSKNFATNGRAESTIYLFDKILKRLSNLPTSLRLKYTNSFKRYFVYHFGLLLLESDTKYINQFISFCKKHYGWWFVARLQLVQKCVSVTNNKNTKKYLSNALFLVTFGYKHYFKQIYKMFIRIFSI